LARGSTLAQTTPYNLIVLRRDIISFILPFLPPECGSTEYRKLGLPKKMCTLPIDCVRAIVAVASIALFMERLNRHILDFRLPPLQQINGT